LGGAGYGLLSYSLSQDVDAALRGVASNAGRAGGRAGGVPHPWEVDEIFRRFFGFSPLDNYFERFSPLDRPRPGPSSPGGGRLPLTEQALKNASRGLPTFRP